MGIFIKQSFILLLILLSYGCKTTSSFPHKLFVELKNSDGSNLDTSKIRVEYVTNSSMGSSEIDSIYADIGTMSFLIFDDQYRKYLILENEGETQQVFELKIKGRGTVSDWSKWMQPSFLNESPYGGWDLMNNQQKEYRVFKIPKKHFMIRYQIKKWEMEEIMRKQSK